MPRNKVLRLALPDLAIRIDGRARKTTTLPAGNGLVATGPELKPGGNEEWRMLTDTFPSALPRIGARRCRGRGFTMVELLTTIVVLAVLLAIASPSLATFINSSRLRATHGELVSALTLARSEATKRGTAVAVGARAPVVGAEFSGGWFVYMTTSPSDDAFDGDENKVVRRYPALSGNQRFGTVGGETRAVFNPRGFLKTSAPVEFRLCGQAGFAVGYRILLEPVGLADVSEDRACS